MPTLRWPAGYIYVFCGRPLPRAGEDWALLQTACLVTRRKPPQHLACPKPDCLKEFKGQVAWHKWIKHIGCHVEEEDSLATSMKRHLAEWALKEGIIEKAEEGKYRLASQEETSVPSLQRDCIIVQIV